MSVDLIVPPGLPAKACTHIRQERRWARFDQPDAPPQEILGAFCCAKHGIGLGEDLERCKKRGTDPCWYVPGARR